MTFTASLAAAWTRNDSLLCVGLDPESAKFPAALKGRGDAIFEFCKTIADATADLACAFKPQIAYFAANRAEDQLEALIRHIHDRHPGIPVILDAKRGDIGATAILCRTSNAGGSDLQFLETGGRKLYQHVAELVATKWNAGGQCALVVGATFPAELAEVRRLVGDMPLLVPGIGAQGGDVEATVSAGRTASGAGLMINSSRAILYAATDKNAGEDYAAAARQVALETRDAINRYRR
ncbi:MAG: orotidine 5'-phosphate decarboxylase [Rhodocyclaceae bacterium]|nr:orotidine 5'-phosphate decarboxylase [Rhodocyclaceae bacterium]